MREILFRGKANGCPMNDEWVEGGFCPKNDRGDYLSIIKCNEPFEGGWFEIQPDTLGQYTGLKDKNGKYIFEGDIVKVLLLDNAFNKTICTFIGMCQFENGAFGLFQKCSDFDRFTAFTSICNVQYEVMGNIHDNPELLESEEEL